MTTPGLREVAIALVLVAISLGVSRWWRIRVSKDIAIGSVRAFVQLVAVGYALQFIFGLHSFWLVMLTFVVMIVVGSHAASNRLKELRGSFLVALAAISAGSLITLATMYLFDIITLEARFIIPLGGMIIGNSMNATALTMERLVSDLSGNRLAIETSLSLGKSWREASQKQMRKAATAGMIAILNFMKTVGIVALPGTMTGMILAGADPLEAVYLQIVVVYMLLSAVTITSVVAVELTIRKFFTRFHQLRHLT